MRFSTRGHYGLKATIDLAQNYGPDPIPLRSVAERQNLSEHYLEQIIALLRKASLVKSVRGSQGGYLLAREPGQITVGEVLRVLEGPIAPVSCVSEEDPDSCNEFSYCLAKNVWAKVRDGIADVLDAISLADLCHETKSND